MRALPLVGEVGPSAATDPARGPLRLPAAILSLHSHRDRSFLHDVTLAHLSGALRRAGFANDLVVAWLPTETNPGEGDEIERLIEALRPYPTVMYERMWSAALAERLRQALPAATLIRLVGEHDMVGAPADHVVRADESALIALMAGLARVPTPPKSRVYGPNLRPVYATPEARPSFLAFPLLGNAGCPYSADARENPAFAGVVMPQGMGRGCSFCVTGNHYEHHAHQEAVALVLEQIRVIRATAPEIAFLVLRDQNPFYYLTEVIEVAEREALGPFTLLIESRADWFLQNEGRFVRALESAKRSSIRLAPFLVGVESFSQPELDRFNKGITAERNIEFLAALHRWHEAHAPAMDLSHTAFGFILFTPWTTLDDLAKNLDGFKATRMHELRGNLLLSRARLYPDTALYYLAERDGLLAQEYESSRDDSSARYGYLPAQPWRFRDAKTARVATLAQLVLARRRARNEPLLLEVLLQLVGGATNPDDITVEAVLQALDRAEGSHVGTPGARRERDVATQSLALAVAKELVNAPSLPVALPAFQLTLLDVEADLGGLDLVIGAPDPVGTIRLSPDEHAPAPIVTVRLRGPEARRFSRALATMAERLRRAATPERWAKTWTLASALARR